MCAQVHMPFLHMKTILGLDISSNTIGYAILEYDEENIILKEHGHIKPPKSDKGSLAFRANKSIYMLEQLFLDKKPDIVASEAYVNKFTKGRSSANTIIVLSVFNEITSIACLRTLNIEPEKYAVVTIRSVLSKLSEASFSAKDEAFEFIIKYFPTFQIKKNKNGKNKKEAYDEADAVAVALTHIIKEKENGKRPNILKGSKRKTSKRS